MTTGTELSRAVRRIAWGLIFLHLDFNLGTLDILPNWWGLCLMYRALGTLHSEVPTLRLLRPLAAGLGALELLEWLGTIVGADYQVPMVHALASALTLYFFFQLWTDLARLAQNRRCPQSDRLFTLRTVDTLMITLLSLPIPWDRAEWAVFCIIAVELTVAFCLSAALFSLSGSLKEGVDIPPEVPL